MTWETVIGLEIHAQLATESKIFSKASITYCESPNTQVREVDFGLPGALPVINKKAVEYAIRFGLAVGSCVNERSEFARKNYFYPDLPKGYQISQFEYPIVSGGELFIKTNESAPPIRIGITRAHLEEDAGKLVHEGWASHCGVDLNRAGTPLLEIVSEPDMTSIAQAVVYATKIRQLVRWLEICDGNMQEGSLRIDANISVNRPNQPMGTRCEIKNLNSFRFLEQALHFERQRQIELLENGEAIEQQTRLFDTTTGETRKMRSKEDAHDYRYFPDPDLPPLLIDKTWIEQIKQSLPQLPAACHQQLVEQYHLSSYDADLLTADKAFYGYFGKVIEALNTTAPEQVKTVVNWLCGDFSALLNTHKIDITESPISAICMAELITCINNGEISGKIAKAVIIKMWQTGDTAKTIITAEGLTQISDEATIEKLAIDIIASNPNQAEQYKQGKDRLFGFFVGQMMKATKGQANPNQVNTILKKLLSQ